MRHFLEIVTTIQTDETGQFCAFHLWNHDTKAWETECPHFNFEDTTGQCDLFSQGQDLKTELVDNDWRRKCHPNCIAARLTK